MININNILKQEPTLTGFGITADVNTNGFSEKEIGQIETCIKWLSEKKVQKKIEMLVTSYGIKHIIERELNTYISNGCLIAAVIHLGIPYKRLVDSPNISVAISGDEIYKNDPNLG